MPAIGFGTCCREGANGETLIESAKAYLANGGRLIDTAQLYLNHEDLAQSIRWVRERGVPRKDIWVTSKVDVKAAKSQKGVVKAVEKSLKQLSLSYLDLMLLHGGERWGVAPEQDVAFWQGLIDAKRAGKVRNIGVSNHNRAEIERLVAATGETPAVNQMEYHPWVPPETRELVRWCQAQGIAVTAYGSLGGSLNKAQGAAVAEVASRHGVTNAQVLLRWALDQGVAVIPGATSEDHIKEDLDVMGFQLDAQDSALLEGSAAPTAFHRWHNCKSGCAA